VAINAQLLRREIQQAPSLAFFDPPAHG
jgi:hypothetical protein